MLQLIFSKELRKKKTGVEVGWIVGNTNLDVLYSSYTREEW